MRRAAFLFLALLCAGCVYSPKTVIIYNSLPPQAGGVAPATPAATPAAVPPAVASPAAPDDSHATVKPPAAAKPIVVAKWTAKPPPDNEANLIAMGDWGAKTAQQKMVAHTMGDYLAASPHPFNAVLAVGDNFYVTLKDTSDPNWQSVFEDVYDPIKIALPFYAVLGNHDYENRKEKVEPAYAAEHPESRFKMPAKWYRLDYPESQPLVTLLMLDSDKDKLTKTEWEEQMRWANEQLSKPRQSKWMVLCAHHPIFANGEHEDGPALEKDWGPLLKKYNVDLYVGGHDHSLQHLEVPGWSTSFVVAGGGGQTLTPIRRNDRGIFFRKLYGFAHIQATADTLRVRLVAGDDGRIVHEFTRGQDRKIAVVQTTDNDQPTPKTAAAGGVSTPAFRAVTTKGDACQVIEKVLSFSDNGQKDAFKKAFDARTAALDQWNKGEDGQKLAKLNGEIDAANKAKDEPKAAELAQQAKPLREAQEAVDLKCRREVNAAIPPKMRPRAAGYALYTAILSRLKPLNPSDEQKQQIYAISVALAAPVDEQTLDKNPLLVPDEPIQSRAYEVVHDHVLSTEQRKALATAATQPAGK